jgi:hypothetical protein
MRYQLATEVVGSALIRENLVVDVGDMRFEFVRDGANRLSRVAASTSVPPGTIRSYWTRADTAFWRAGIEGASDAHERVLAALRSLESHIAFSAQGAIGGFSWEKLEVELVPETPEDVAPLKKLQVVRSYPELTAGLGEDLLRMVAMATESHKDTEVAKAFWREARREFHSQRYIQAYYNFYFVLEGLYAQGKSDTAKVVKAFSESQVLARSTAFMLAGLRRYPYHRRNLSRFFEDHHIAMDVPGAQSLIVRLRGRLHHYAAGSPKLQPTPFNQAHFESPAWFLMGLTTHVIVTVDSAIGPMMVAHPDAKRG